jgi:hypothetical protein
MVDDRRAVPVELFVVVETTVKALAVPEAPRSTNTKEALLLLQTFIFFRIVAAF